MILLVCFSLSFGFGIIKFEPGGESPGMLSLIEEEG